MKELLRNVDSVYKLLELVAVSRDIDAIFTEVVEELRGLFESERCTLYILDKEKNELYSKVVQKCEVTDLRIPVDNNSIAGYSVLSNKEVIVENAYDDNELKRIDPDLSFGKSIDSRCSFVTKSVLSAPLHYGGEIIGAVQAFNKNGGFLEKDLNAIREFGLILGLMLNNAIVTEELNKYRRASEGADKAKED
ncbi:MAG: GAF domain-containing protein [Proteobacteria bacterium]|nr:GAF domain-containing protein [Pseudomonadota bacterium]